MQIGRINESVQSPRALFTTEGASLCNYLGAINCVGAAAKGAHQRYHLNGIKHLPLPVIKQDRPEHSPPWTKARLCARERSVPSVK